MCKWSSNATGIKRGGAEGNFNAELPVLYMGRVMQEHGMRAYYFDYFSWWFASKLETAP